jgi:type VI secretion system secreted protein VgrG
VIPGPQTAVVVGASGNEIETDKHGRIKVQFHWDRLGKNDQNSSCWVRVAQPWAGKGYGFFSLPRVGDEVVVHFLDGDPDRPLIIGAVYNNVNMMAWKLPEHATVTGFKSRSTKGGDKEGKEANELRFDDEKGKEYIWFHAERDFHRQVEHDAFDWVGNNESVHVTLTRKEVIGENWFVDVTKDVMHNLGKDLHVNVAGDIFYTGGATFQLKLTKDFNAKVDGDVSIEAAGKITLKAASIILEGSSAVTLKSGGSTVNLAGAGVDIVGSMVKVNSGGGGAGASPGKVDKAKKEDSITPEKKSDYEKTFDDPLATTDGGTGPNKSKAS